ncbi:hypothetical protein C2E23DRAFT_924013 [Lenzites betulinus]|nr:hypothetical protein C2E23DRAFT_924013 [Lenzites betulinus]
MSFGQQNRTTESWNSDPNSFSNTSGPDAGFQTSNQRSGDMGEDFQQQQQFGSQRPTHDPTDTSNWSAANADPSARRAGFGDSGASTGHSLAAGGGQGDQLWSAGPGENNASSGYGRGNTTDVNTVGAGGNQFGSTGRGAGGVDGDNWRQGGGGDNFDNDNGPTPGAGKASMGDRLKGNAEKLAGRVTGNPAMVERGQIRKSGDPDDTNYSNANNY